MIQAKIIADSINEFGNRITTMIVTFPRIILSEFNTHRMFSRNSASSRAIPFEKMLKSVKENPFIPIAWQKDHKGMQGVEYFTESGGNEARLGNWLAARNHSIREAESLNYEGGVTKQICNRLLEPFMYHTVIVTATEWKNFFALRCPRYDPFGDGNKSYRSWKDITQDYLDLEPDASPITRLKLNRGQAEIHMMALAEAMWDAYNESNPTKLNAREWHIPFGDKILISGTKGLEANTQKAIKIAIAMCARVSYTVIGEEDKVSNFENDIKLHDRLLESKHMSPFEHCARTMTDLEYASHHNGVVKSTKEDDGEDAILNYEQYFNGQYGNRTKVDYYGWCKNFRGFIQYRALIPNENITK